MHAVLFSLFFFSFCYAGFYPDTVVLSPQSTKPLGQLQRNFCVISYDTKINNYLQGTVSNHRAYISPLACRVVCDNDISFVASPNQLVLTSGEWCLVRDLKKGDRLKCYDSYYVTVLSVEVCNNENILCEITVEPYHTFCVTERGIIAHNHPIAIFAVAPAITSIIPVVAKTAGVMAIIGAALYSLFAKNGGHGIGKNNINSPSNCSTPPLPPDDDDDDDEFKKKHPHGQYEDIRYHHKNSGGTKSPAPIDGQRALDNSLRIKDTKPHRIGISEDQFVVLRETSPRLFHGYVCEWEQLTDTMQKVLRKAQWVSHNGKIICK